MKCRIGIDYREEYDFFSHFANQVAAAGVDALIVHARNAVLSGLSPKENREIPPLKYDFVHRLKRERPALTVILNGGLDRGGRHWRAPRRRAGWGDAGTCCLSPARVVGGADRLLVNPSAPLPEPWDIVEQMVRYAQERMVDGVRLHSITRHMHGIMAGREGARAWRRFLSGIAAAAEARPEMLYSALPILKSGLAA